MTKKEALEGSIKKWKRIIEDRRATDNGIANCPLCKVYFDSDGWRNCFGCPVSKAVTADGCQGTPYWEWIDHQRDAHKKYEIPHRRQKDCPECLRLAKEELAFLESLR